MKVKTMFLWVSLLMVSPVFAQSAGDTVFGRHYDPFKSNVPIWLDWKMGANYADCYDAGTVPFRYDGFGANVEGGVTIRWGRCQVQAEAQGFYTMLSSPSGEAIDATFSTEFLYRCANVKRFGFWAGGSLQGFMDNKDIPALMNASWSMTLFGNLCATGMVECNFAFTHEGMYNLRPLLTAYGKLSLPLMGVASRPGYSYIGHPTINEDMLLADNELFAKVLTGASAELGLYLNLRNSNRIGLSYRWNYLTTGKKGIYRFDHALHAINLSFMFRIN